jgi:hypothetical protein
MFWHLRSAPEARITDDSRTGQTMMAAHSGEPQMRKLIVWTTLTVLASGMGSTAYAGEVTGGPHSKQTPGGDSAKSICAFSGQEDGNTLIGFNPDGSPIIITVDTGPGLVQTPHMENSAGIIHDPGIPGDACRGNVSSPL